MATNDQILMELALLKADIAAIRHLITEPAVTGPPIDTGNDPADLVGVNYDFKFQAEAFLAPRLTAGYEFGSRLKALMRGPWPKRLLFLNRDKSENSPQEIDLLYFNADLVDSDPELMQIGGMLRGSPIHRMRRLNGTVSNAVIIISPINRRVARHGATVTEHYAANKAMRWAFERARVAKEQDDVERALAAVGQTL